MTTFEKLPRQSPVRAQNAQAAVANAADAVGSEVDMMASMGRWAWFVLFAAAGVLYVVCRGAYFVGFFNDDAFYLIGARSLLEGGFREMNNPARPPLIQYLPGWPMLLTPAAALGSLTAARLTAAAAMLLSAAAAAWWFEDDLDEEGRLMLAAVCLLNPLALSLSGAVLADAPFTLAMLTLLAAAKRLWSRTDASVWFALGAGAGASFLLRPVGLALPAALVGALAWEGRRREAALVVGGALCCVVPWLTRNLFAGGHALLYFRELAAPWESGGTSGRPMANAAYYLNELYARTLLRWPPASGAFVAGCLASAAGLALAVRGLARGGLADGRRAAALAVALLAGVLLVWEKRSGRYLLPLIPFAAGWALAGLGELSRRPGLAALRRAAVLLALASYAAPGLRIAGASLSPTASPSLGPERTWAWIRANTPPDAVFGSELDGRLFLRTGRRTLTLPRSGEAGQLGPWAARAGVGYILVEKTGDVMATASGRGAHDATPEAERLASARAAGLERLFEDLGEGTSIFAVKNQPPGLRPGG